MGSRGQHIWSPASLSHSLPWHLSWWSSILWTRDQSRQGLCHVQETQTAWISCLPQLRKQNSLSLGLHVPDNWWCSRFAHFCQGCKKSDQQQFCSKTVFHWFPVFWCFHRKVQRGSNVIAWESQATKENPRQAAANSLELIEADNIWKCRGQWDLSDWCRVWVWSASEHNL